MAFELWSYIVDPGDGTIKMAHVFYGKTEAEAERYREEHLSHCKYMQGADKGEARGELIEETVRIAELPKPGDFADGDDEIDDDEPEETDEDEEPGEDDEDDEDGH